MTRAKCTHRSRFSPFLSIAATTPSRANRSCAFFTPLFLSGLSPSSRQSLAPCTDERSQRLEARTGAVDSSSCMPSRFPTWKRSRVCLATNRKLCPCLQDIHKRIHAKSPHRTLTLSFFQRADKVENLMVLLSHNVSTCHEFGVAHRHTLVQLRARPHYTSTRDLTSARTGTYATTAVTRTAKNAMI